MTQVNRRTDLIGLLLEDHQAVEALLAKIGQQGTDTDALFAQIRDDLVVHETAEEEVLYPVVRRCVDGGDALADARIAEQQEAADLLAEMDALAPGSAELGVMLDKLNGAATAHAHSEEADVFPALAAAVTAEHLEVLGQAYVTAKAAAPTHPGTVDAAPAPSISHLPQQQDPRGDLLKARPGGDTEPGGWVPPYEGRTTGTHEQNDTEAASDTAGLGQAAGHGDDLDDLDMAHHKGSPDDARPDLVAKKGTAKYPTP